MSGDDVKLRSVNYLLNPIAKESTRIAIVANPHLQQKNTYKKAIAVPIQLTTSIRQLSPSGILAAGLVIIIAMMILPVPAFLLDLGLALSFSISILIFTIAIFLNRPLEFSSFPTVLLASLILRLALNISSTKLIIGNGHTGTDAAGKVIEGFALFVMDGSLFLGLVVFSILLIVNFVVINKGAARMAEVGARFALDAMPGKQLAIDADMAAGAIDHREASLRREREQAETTFFGSLDGASKFVKGDAIAGLLITALNLLVGTSVGIFVHELSIGEAFETYAILTVGDGLVSQIPAVIISVGTALLLARGNAQGSTQTAINEQLSRYPAALGTVACLMALLSMVPGLPFLPFITFACLLGYTAYYKSQAQKRDRVLDLPTRDLETPTQPTTVFGDLLNLDDVHVEFSQNMIDLVIDPVTGLDSRISSMRRHVAMTFGLLLPEIRLTDNPTLADGTYIIRIQGVEQAKDVLRPGRLLTLLPGQQDVLIPGDDVREPVYGAPARWISVQDREQAVLDGLTTIWPTEVLATHLLETLKRNFSRLLTHRALRRLLEEMVKLTDTRRADANRRLLEEMIPDRVQPDILLGVLKLLLDEQVSIRNITLIIEAIAEARPFHQDIEGITEHVRQRLGFQLVSELKRSDGTIPLIQLSPEWEKEFGLYQISNDRSFSDIALPPEEFTRLANGIGDRIAKASENGHYAAVVTSSRRRRFVRTVMVAKGLPNPVLSFEEIGVDARPSLVGIVPV